MSEEKVPVSLLEETASAVFREEKVSLAKKVSVVFVPLGLMQELNLRYRGKNSPTDVLAFPLQEKVGPARK
ncbi:rRNA maturation RNAse YbeY, partial [Candidatus Aerophobetes bacterium]|nr:rRNA maturation RNAse YbeY [Candidatus Aerophobetes bacterium]